MNKQIRKLNSNGYAYYRTIVYWEPLEASAVICGFDPATIDYKSMPANVEQIYKLLERVFNTDDDTVMTKKIIISNNEKMDFVEQHCSSFYYFDEVYGVGYLWCFDAIKLIHWIKYKMRIEVPSELELDLYIPF